MSAQNLKMQKGVGSFVVGGIELTPDSAAGSPYPSSAGAIDFTTRSTTQQNMLYGTNHPTTPQQTGVTVAFLYSDWEV
jgi:hypothetical protein